MAPIAPAASTASESLVTAQDAGISGWSFERRAPRAAGPAPRGAARPVEQLRSRQQRRQQHAELIHRPQRQHMRDFVGETHLSVDVAHRLGERATPGHDQHRPAPSELERVRAARSSSPSRPPVRSRPPPTLTTSGRGSLTAQHRQRDRGRDLAAVTGERPRGVRHR